jgi:hypothetical protein
MPVQSKFDQSIADETDVYQEAFDQMTDAISLFNQQKALFYDIKQKVNGLEWKDFIKSNKTKNGNTQVSERPVIDKFRKIFTIMGLTFEEAGSQQSKDFRNVGGIGLDIEIKKTNSDIVTFNDTCPNKDIWYITLYAGKEYKRNPENNIPAQLLYNNGEDFLQDAPWLVEYKKDFTAINDKYGRGENKKNLTGIIQVYTRAKFSAPITSFLSPEAVKHETTKKAKTHKTKITDYTAANALNDLNDFKVPQLKEICADNDLPLSGLKSVLMARVWGILHPDQEPQIRTEEE